MLPDDPQADDPLYGDDAPPDEHERGGGAERLRGVIPELVRKVAVAGLGAVFMTEEGIRSLAGQLKLPKEAMTYILSQAEKTKDQVGQVVSEEVRRFLQSEKLRDEFMKLLSGMTIEIKAEVKLKPDSAPHVTVGELKAKTGGKKKKDDEA